MQHESAYLLIIYRTTEGATDSAVAARAMEGHRALQAEARDAGELHAVAQLAEPSTSKLVRITKDGHSVTDGPFMETKEWLVGVYLLECESEAAAIERAKLITVDDGHAVEVRPVAWMPSR